MVGDHEGGGRISKEDHKGEEFGCDALVVHGDEGADEEIGEENEEAEMECR